MKEVPGYALSEWTVDQLTITATTMAGMAALCYSVAQLCEGYGLDPSGPEGGFHSAQGILDDICDELRSRGIEPPQ